MTYNNSNENAIMPEMPQVDFTRNVVVLYKGKWTDGQEICLSIAAVIGLSTHEDNRNKYSCVWRVNDIMMK